MRLILVKEKKRDELSSICQSNVDAKHDKDEESRTKDVLQQDLGY